MSTQLVEALRELLALAESVTPGLRDSPHYSGGRWGRALDAARAALAAHEPAQPVAQEARERCVAALLRLWATRNNGMSAGDFSAVEVVNAVLNAAQPAQQEQR